MILIFIVCLASSINCLKIVNNDDELNQNVTTLYPVENITYYVKEIVDEQSDNTKQIANKTTDIVVKEKKHRINVSNFDTIDAEDDDTIKTNDMKNKTKGLKIDMGSWKINATYKSSKLDESKDKNNSMADMNLINENESKGKEFRPSPHLGNYYDEDSFILPTQATLQSLTPIVKPSTGFFGTPRDFIKLDYKHHSSHHTIESPYNFESIPRVKDWKFETGLKTKPTMEVPLNNIPAGGLYKLPDAFKEKPGTDGDGDDFGLDFNDAKDTSVKKRGNPWKKLLNLVTALLPVGIIISALTPSIITLESTENNPHFPSHVSRRSEESADLPPISERCKRRLLCELHADNNYMRAPSTTPHNQHLCYKIPCNDPQALSKVLRWLLHHNYRGNYPRALYDRRGLFT